MYLLLPYAGMGCNYRVQEVEITSSTTTHTGQRQAKTLYYVTVNATGDHWRSSGIIDLCWTKRELR